MEGFVEKVTASALHRGYGVWLFRVLLIAGATVWIYSPAFHGDWIWDDNIYLTGHLHLQDRANLWKTWFAPGSLEDYYPLESAVLFIQWHFWHNHTLGYHLTNVILQIVNALLLWRLLGKIGLRHAWIGGLVFAIHPLMVESVAWIVELKNTLSLPPLLLAMGAYIDYEDSRRDRDYFLALGLFLVAMLCKTSVLMFPAVILLYIWWKRERIIWSDLKATVPFFVISLLLGVLTARLQHQHGMPATILVDWPSRFATVGWEMVFCCSKFFYPGTLLPLYPSGLVTSSTAFDLVPWLLLFVVLGLLWFNRKGWGRHAALGLGFFLLNLVPVFAFALMNAATMIWTMDHVIYLPTIGLIGLCVAALDQLAIRLSAPLRLLGLAAVAMLIALLALKSHAYAKIFCNEEIFWTYTLRYNPGSATAHNSLGSLFLKEGRFTEANRELQEALRLDPSYAPAYNNMGLLIQRTGRFSETEAQYEKPIAINPDMAEPHDNMGLVLSQNGQLSEAIDHFKASLKLEPDDPEVHYNLANALSQAGRLPEALEQYGLALKLNPDFAEAHYSLGNALVQSGRLADAAEQFRAAISSKADYADAHANLGNALLQLGQVAPAIDQYQRTLKLNPRDVDTRNILGLVLMQTGCVPEAQAQFEAILQIDPHYASALSALTKLKASPKIPPPPSK